MAVINYMYHEHIMMFCQFCRHYSINIVDLQCVCFCQVGYTSAPGEGGIVNFKEFNRRFSPHVVGRTVLWI